MTGPEHPHERFRRWAATMLAHRTPDHGIHHDAARARTLYQTSTMSALVDGIYDGSVTIAELLEHGDFGVGTFNHLDGEMIVNEGVCFHLFSSGEARVASPDDLTPFAAVTTFEADTTFDVETPTSRPTSLHRSTSACRARTSSMRSGSPDTSRRSPPEPRRGRRPRTAAARSDRQRDPSGPSRGQAGVLVGFRTPDYEQGISVAGYHLHFLNDEHTGGGHAFDFVLDEGVVEISTVSELRLSLPTSGPFLAADLNSKDMDAGIRKSEG